MSLLPDTTTSLPIPQGKIVSREELREISYKKKSAAMNKILNEITTNIRFAAEAGETSYDYNIYGSNGYRSINTSKGVLTVKELIHAFEGAFPGCVVTYMDNQKDSVQSIIIDWT